MAVLRRMNDLYVTYRGRYVRSRPDGAGYYVPKRGKGYHVLTDAILMGHIDREYSLCLFSGKEMTKFVCFDVDRNPLENIWKVLDALKKAGVDERFIHLSNSGGKGYHVEIFFNGVVALTILRKLYEYVLAESGLTSVDVEFRPTHTQSIKLPLSVHPRTGRMCWFVERDTLKEIEDAGYIFGIERMVPEDMADIIGKLPRVERPLKVVPTSAPTVRYGSLVVDELPVLGDAGERHRMMLQVANWARSSGMDAEQIEAFIHEWYNAQDKSFAKTEGHELDADIRNIARWSAGLPQFKGFYHRTDGKISKEDFDWILSHKERVWRKVLFLVMCGGAKHGQWISTYKRMSETLGVSVNGVRKAVDSLTKAGALVLKYGEVKKKGGKPVRESTRYRVPREAVITEDDVEIVGDVRMDFDRSYYVALETMYGEGLPQRLSPREKKDFEEHRRRNGLEVNLGKVGALSGALVE